MQNVDLTVSVPQSPVCVMAPRLHLTKVLFGSHPRHKITIRKNVYPDSGCQSDGLRDSQP